MFVKGCFLEARSLVVTDGLAVTTDSIKDVELKPCNVALHLPVSADLKPREEFLDFTQLIPDFP